MKLKSLAMINIAFMLSEIFFISDLAEAKLKNQKTPLPETELMTCTVTQDDAGEKETEVKKITLHISENGPRYTGVFKTKVGDIQIEDNFGFGDEPRTIELTYGPGEYKVSGHPLRIFRGHMQIKIKCKNLP